MIVHLILSIYTLRLLYSAIKKGWCIHIGNLFADKESQNNENRILQFVVSTSFNVRYNSFNMHYKCFVHTWLQFPSQRHPKSVDGPNIS